MNTIPAFAYTTADQAPLYRAIMRVFVQAAERCVCNLRIQDVVDAVLKQQHNAGVEEIESAIEQLREWGNLQTVPDTSTVQTVDDFLKPRHLLQMSPLGEAAERAVSLFEESSACKPELHLDTLTWLKEISRESQPDAVQLRRQVLLLRHSFLELTVTLQTLIRKLEGILAQPAFDIDEARDLIEHAERFMSELVLASDPVHDFVHVVEAAGQERIFHNEAERRQWEYLRDWFVSEPGQPSNADVGRQRLRALVTNVLGVITRIQESRTHKVDRADDFRILARSFAAAESDTHAHRLWRSAFGLCPARHLIVPSVEVAMTSKLAQSNAQGAVFSRVIDRTEEKQRLAIAAHEEAKRILAAQSRFSAGRMRLSQLEYLEMDEFDLLLDLLGEAVSAKVFSSDAVEIFSRDGSLRIRLEPIEDSQPVMIMTDGGMFSGPDYFISIDEAPLSLRERDGAQRQGEGRHGTN